MKDVILNVENIQGDLLEYIRKNYVSIYIENKEQLEWLKKNQCVGYIPSSSYLPYYTIPICYQWDMNKNFPENFLKYENKEWLEKGQCIKAVDIINHYKNKNS